MTTKELIAKQKEDLTKDFQEIRNKFVNKILSLHDEQSQEERKMQVKFAELEAQEKELEPKKEVIPEVKEIEAKQKK